MTFSKRTQVIEENVPYVLDILIWGSKLEES